MFQDCYVRVISFQLQFSMAPLPSTRANHGLHKRMHTLQASDYQWTLQLAQRSKAKNPPRKLAPFQFLRLESWTEMGKGTHLGHEQQHLNLGKAKEYAQKWFHIWPQNYFMTQMYLPFTDIKCSMHYNNHIWDDKEFILTLDMLNCLKGYKRCLHIPYHTLLEKKSC